MTNDNYWFNIENKLYDTMELINGDVWNQECTTQLKDRVKELSHQVEQLSKENKRYRTFIEALYKKMATMFNLKENIDSSDDIIEKLKDVI